MAHFELTLLGPSAYHFLDHILPLALGWEEGQSQDRSDEVRETEANQGTSQDPNASGSVVVAQV